MKPILIASALSLSGLVLFLAWNDLSKSDRASAEGVRHQPLSALPPPTPPQTRAAVSAEPTGVPCEGCGVAHEPSSDAHPVLDPVLAEFKDWARRNAELTRQNRGLSEADRQTGLALAQRRLPVMRELIRTAPERALDNSIGFAAWASLPEAIRAEVERPFSATADYEVFAFCDPVGTPARPEWSTRMVHFEGSAHFASVYGERLSLASKRSVPVQGIVLEGIAALWDSPVQVVDATDAEAAAKFLPVVTEGARSQIAGALAWPKPILALVGGSVRTFSTEAELTERRGAIRAAESDFGPHTVSASLLASAAGGWSPSEGPAPATLGQSGWANTPKSKLVLRVVFAGQSAASHPYTQTALMNAYQAASGNFSNYSYGKTQLNVTVPSQVFVLPNAQAYYQNPPSGVSGSDRMRTDARAAALAAGINASSFDMVAYWHMPLTGGDWTAPAFANLQAPDSWYNGNQGGRTQSIIMHEVGHNYGLGHANSWSGFSGTGFESRLNNAENGEYGDPYDVMAADFGTVDGLPIYPAGHFSMNEKSYLRWIDNANIRTVTESGTYRVFPFDNQATPLANTLLGLRILNTNGDAIWVGLRSAFPSTAGKAFIVWAHNPRQHRLVDAYPLSSPGGSFATDLADAALGIDDTWTDPTRTVRVTLLETGGTGANSYIDVRIGIADTPVASFFADSNEQTRGLTGSYINTSLRSSGSDTDWTDGSQVISGSRIDAKLYFPTSSWGQRSTVGLTGGTDADWEDFSVQWDGWVRIHRQAMLATVSDDGSRLWIDRDGSGTFGTSELADNNFGNGQGFVTGNLTPMIPPGLYRIRIQYEEGDGGNAFAIAEVPFEFDLPASPKAGLTASYFNTGTHPNTDYDWYDGSPAISGARFEWPWFTGNGWGQRSQVGLTGGTDADWDNFHASWFGVLRVGDRPMRFTTLATAARLWIDANANDLLEFTSTEYSDNNWSSPGTARIGPDVENVPANSNVEMLIQFKAGTGNNTLRFGGVPAQREDDHADERVFGTLIPSSRRIDGDIRLGGESDFFAIDIPAAGSFTAYTLGSTDTFGILYNSSGTIIASSNDAQAPYNQNFEFTANIPAPGRYYISVRGGLASVWGDYTLVTRLDEETQLGAAVEQAPASVARATELITPSGITQIAGDAIIPGFVPQNLINNSGLASVPASDAGNYTSIQHTAGFASGTWATATGSDPYYFAGALPSPAFVLDLGSVHELSALVIWGYAGIANEATNFLLEFSEDGGANYRRSKTVASSSMIGTGVATLPFGATYRANRVRITMTDNARGRSFSTNGGDRVGLAEIKFIGKRAVSGWALQTDISLDGFDAARSPSIGNSADSAFEMTFPEAGRLTWWWKVSSEQSFDFLQVFSNGSLIASISGEVDWNFRELAIPAGGARILFKYAKDGSVIQGADAAWVDQIHFEPTSDGALDARGLALDLTGQTYWFNQSTTTFDGVDAMQSGPIGDNASSQMRTTIVGPASLAFRWQVSSELNWDFARFKVNGVTIQQISGVVPWSLVRHELPAGSHEILWEYAKDGSFGVNADAAWVDTVVIADPNTNPQLIDIGGGFQVRFTSVPGVLYGAEFSTDLSTWKRYLSQQPSGGTSTTIGVPTSIGTLRPLFIRIVR